MKNVSEIKDCYGCGVCAISCAHKLINIIYNQDGFLTPVILNQDKCTGCGCCVSVCSFINVITFAPPQHSYAAWSNDLKNQRRSTSGGVSFELAVMKVREGATFCGVRYNTKYHRAEHFITNELIGIQESIGSKYLQSFTVDAFRLINRKQNNIIVGTPCQIASLRRYVRKFHCEEHFLLVDFFCHGVPSMLMWKKYLKENAKNVGEIDMISWRNKDKGWRNSYCVSIKGYKNSIQSWNGNDDFFTLFLGNACLNKACYDDCEFKYSHSSADIRIGDCWSNQFKNNRDGVCATIAFTDIGNEALKRANIHLEEYSFEQISEGQMKVNAKRPWYYGIIMELIKDDNRRLSGICRIIRLISRINVYYKRIIKFIK